MARLQSLLVISIYSIISIVASDQTSEPFQVLEFDDFIKNLNKRNEQLGSNSDIVNYDPKNLETRQKVDQTQEFAVEDFVKGLEQRIDATKKLGRKEAARDKASTKEPDCCDEPKKIVIDQNNQESFSNQESNENQENLSGIDSREIFEDDTADTYSRIQKRKIKKNKSSNKNHKSRQAKKYYSRNKCDDRSSRGIASNCPDFGLDKNLNLIASSKSRFIARTELIANRIASTATNLALRRGRFLSCLFKPFCDCMSAAKCANNNPTASQLVNAAASAAAAADAAADAAAAVGAKRDVEIAAAGATASKLDTSVSAGGVSIGSSLDTASETGAKLSVGDGSVSSSFASSSGIASDLHVGTGLGTGLGLGLGLGSDSLLGTRRNLLNQFNGCSEIERRMIMDDAIEEAAHMIRSMALDSRAAHAGPRARQMLQQDRDFDRRVLGLAIDLVNKVTDGVPGAIRYRSVDEYLNAPRHYDPAYIDEELGMGPHGSHLDELDYVNQALGGHDDPYGPGPERYGGGHNRHNYDMYDDYPAGPLPAPPVAHPADAQHLHHDRYARANSKNQRRFDRSPYISRSLQTRQGQQRRFNVK
ncbi:uncharacterized protein LOC106655491 [Trichogramma pretiosum]|uniref:uncharacterized protein LOC106655491 n=1 Tax=Trichogramma pretiosum TaxID=7493 RepID=UPI0006C96B93|nr:uncharacterized protein LOC106655491 [Trichogramma pretiosum]